MAKIDKQIKQFAALVTYDRKDLEEISYDLIEILMPLDSKDNMRWYLQSAINSINEIANVLEHEALLIEVGLGYVKGNEKLLFYKNILKIRLEKNRKEISSLLELMVNRNYLVTDSSAFHMINKAKEIGHDTVESHDRYIAHLQSLD